MYNALKGMAMETDSTTGQLQGELSFERSNEMTLVDKVVRYSKNERRAFAELPVDGTPISTVDLTKKIYGKSRKPFNARQTVLGLMVKLSQKVKKNREPFSIQRSDRRGPHPVEFWLQQ